MKEKKYPWKISNTPEMQEKAKLFREKVKKVEEEIDIEQKEKNYPSILRVDLALYKIQRVPGYLVGSILNDMFPEATKEFAMKVAEEMKSIAEESVLTGVELKPQRYEWVKRWAESKSKEATPRERGKELFYSEEVQKAIEIAKEKGLIEGTGESLRWTGEKELCAYFFGRLLCGDKTESRGKYETVVYGKPMRGADFFNSVFGFSINETRNTRKTKQNAPPSNFEIVDDIVKKAKIQEKEAY